MEAAEQPPAPPTPPATGPRPTVGGVINQAFSHYAAHALTLIGVALAIFFVAGVIEGLLRESDSWVLQLLAALVTLIATTLYTGFVVSLVADVRDGKRDFTVGELLNTAAPAIPRLIGNGILLGIAVGIGLVLLIAPGLFLLTIWAVTAPAIVIERRGAIEAFGRSHELVRGHGWTVFGAIVVAFLIVLGAGVLALAIGSAIAGVAGAIILAIVVHALAAPVAALISSVLFFELGGGEPSTPAQPEPAA